MQVQEDYVLAKSNLRKKNVLQQRERGKNQQPAPHSERAQMFYITLFAIYKLHSLMSGYLATTAGLTPAIVQI